MIQNLEDMTFKNKKRRQLRLMSMNEMIWGFNNHMNNMRKLNVVVILFFIYPCPSFLVWQKKSCLNNSYRMLCDQYIIYIGFDYGWFYINKRFGVD